MIRQLTKEFIGKQLSNYFDRWTVSLMIDYLTFREPAKISIRGRGRRRPDRNRRVWYGNFVDTNVEFDLMFHKYNLVEENGEVKVVATFNSTLTLTFVTPKFEILIEDGDNNGDRCLFHFQNNLHFAVPGTRKQAGGYYARRQVSDNCYGLICHVKCRKASGMYGDNRYALHLYQMTIPFRLLNVF